jgi:tetratricopeptide (TPR) repeat protein
VTPSAIVWAFTQFWAANWHPLTWLSHMLDVEVWGMWPGGHHATSALLHAINTLLLYRLLVVITGATWRSAMVAALFALHPLHVESVAWVSERKDVLSAFFWLLTLHWYVRYARRPGGAGYLLVSVGVAASLMSKPMAVTLPLVLLLIDIWPLRRIALDGALRDWAHRLLPLAMEKLPWLALAVLTGLFTLYAQTRAMVPVDALGVGERLGYAVQAYATYLWQSFWPARLSFLYLPKPLGVGEMALSLATVVLPSWIVVHLWRKHGKLAPLVGWLWYLITLLPVIGIVKVGAQVHADRYTYLPLVGFWVALLWSVDPGSVSARWRSALAVAAISALAVCGGLSWRQASYWQTDYTLFPRAIALDPANYVAYVQLGEAQLHRGQYVEAEQNALVALRLSSTPTVALYSHLLLGNLAYARGDARRALDHYAIARGAWERSPLVHYNIGTAHLALGQLNEAERSLLRAIELHPGYSEAYNNLGVALTQRGDNGGAITAYQRALAIDPNNHGARFNLARRHLAAGRPALAIAELQELLRRNPTHRQAVAELTRIRAALAGS